MKIAISGTYSTGKTTTTLALAFYTGLPRTHAKTMRDSSHSFTRKKIRRRHSS